MRQVKPCFRRLLHQEHKATTAVRLAIFIASATQENVRKKKRNQDQKSKQEKEKPKGKTKVFAMAQDSESKSDIKSGSDSRLFYL